MLHSSWVSIFIWFLGTWKPNPDPEELNVPPVTNIDNYPILREEIEAAVKSLKKGKSLGIDNIPGGRWSRQEEMPWSAPYIKSAIRSGRQENRLYHGPSLWSLPFPHNYPTISLIGHPSKAILKHQAETIIAEEQAGFRPGRSKTEQILNLRILFHTSNINKTSNTSLLILKRPLTEHDIN